MDAAAQSEPSHRVLHEEPQSVTGVCGNVIYRVNGGESTLEGFERTRLYAEELIRRYPNGIAKLVYSMPGSPMPSPELRKRIHEVAQSHAPYTLCMPMVFAPSD